MKHNIAESFEEFFEKHAETLADYDAKAETLTAENPYSVETYIDEALAIEDDDFDDEHIYDFEPMPDDDESAPRFTP